MSQHETSGGTFTAAPQLPTPAAHGDGPGDRPRVPWPVLTVLSLACAAVSIWIWPSIVWFETYAGPLLDRLGVTGDLDTSLYVLFSVMLVSVVCGAAAVFCAFFASHRGERRPVSQFLAALVAALPLFWAVGYVLLALVRPVS